MAGARWGCVGEHGEGVIAAVKGVLTVVKVVENVGKGQHALYRL